MSRPTTLTFQHAMKKVLLVLAAIALVGVSDSFAQKKDQNVKMYEEAQARKVVPEIRTFVTPQICDMQMLSKSRETFGPYYFQIKSIEDTFNFELRNFQNRALYRAVQESDADAVIEPLFDTYVYEKDGKTLVIELSGYPVKYTNFRPATSAEVDMIGVVYPTANTSVSIESNTGKGAANAANKDAVKAK